MKSERLFQIIGLVDEDLVEEAVRPPTRKENLPWFFQNALKYTIAACLCLLFTTISIEIIRQGGLRGAITEAPAATATAPAASAPSSAGGAESSEPFLSYAGPVLPLTTAEETDLTAQRRLTFVLDQKNKARVYDYYTLTNPTDTDITTTLYYPITGQLGNFDQFEPRYDQWYCTPLAGRYAGSFQSALGPGETGSHNLDEPSTWEAYAAVMERGDLEYALSEQAVLDEVVTVYEFTDFTAPTDEYRAATLAMEFTIDQERTQILTYGFNGSTWNEETGWRQYDFFVPNGQRRDTNPKLLVVQGTDLTDYTLQGYEDGGCNIPIGGVSCTVTRSEMTLEKLIDRLCRNYLEENENNFSGIVNTDARSLPLRLYKQCVKELLTEYGLLSRTPVDRYQFGRLDDLISEALILDRIFYFASPEITIPAGESLDVTVWMDKEASFDFAGSGSSRTGVEGYDFVTTLGSTFAFTQQRLNLEYYDYEKSCGANLEEGFPEGLLVRHNLEDCLASDGLLDMDIPYYYFDLKR